MTDRRKFLGGATALGALLLTGCEKAQQTMEGVGILLNPRKGRKRLPTYRYRITVNVDTPEGVKSGSSVIEVRAVIGGPNEIPSPGMLMTNISGEAVTVDLGKRGLMFAVLRSEKRMQWAYGGLMNLFPEWTAEQLLALPEGADSYVLDLEKALRLPLDKPFELPRKLDTGRLSEGKPVLHDNYPVLVRFTDPLDRRTVRRVDPDDLAASFGKGVKLKSITLARTEAPVTWEIVKTLPWVEKLEGSIVKYPMNVMQKDIPPIHLLIESDFSVR